MKILKFGGTSVGSPETIRTVAGIVAQSSRRNQVVVVVSAMSKVTDQLIAMSDLAAHNHTYQTHFQALCERHRGAVRELAAPAQRASALQSVDDLLGELEQLLHGLSLIRERTPRTLDVVMSFGERLSARIVAGAFGAHGLDATMMDARDFIRTDEHFGSAHVDLAATARRIKRSFAKQRHAVPVVTGFIGATARGETTTLGRGGSDYTAALVGAALGASAVEIWTDVDGFMTADPRKVSGARVIERLRYAEAAELAHFGARVLHTPTIRPAEAHKIPIVIKNTLQPAAAGTSINTKPRRHPLPITGVASIPAVGLLQLQGIGLQGVPGSAERFFRTLAERAINILLITQASSEYSICVALATDRLAEAKRAVEHEFAHERRFGQVEAVHAEPNYAIIAIVGEQMRHRPGIAGRVFTALGEAGVNVSAIAQGSSELNISVVVRQKDETRALGAIHDTFFSK